MSYLEDHGLPLVQLRERRRELVVALIGCKDPISATQLTEIAMLQHAIAAMESVIVDLDAEMQYMAPQKTIGSGSPPDSLHCCSSGRIPCRAWPRCGQLGTGGA